MNHSGNSSKGQILVIFVITLLVLLFFIGLALDAGSVYVTYGGLKRAVDSASIAAANEFKNNPNLTLMKAAAEETFNLMNVDFADIDVLLCDADKDGYRDADLPPIFSGRCPDTNPFDDTAEKPRKLVYVEAQQKAPLYFLSLMGFNSVNLHTNSIAEAAPLDIVIVLDTSESMASDTPGFSINHAYDPSACNAANNCSPMFEAKEAAKALIDTLADGYDQVAVVTYDLEAHVRFPLGYDLTAAASAIDAIGVQDADPVVYYIWDKWYAHPGSYNPLNSEDLDGDGRDEDDFEAMYGPGNDCPFHPTDPALDPPHLLDRFWDVADGAPDLYGWGGVPCDRDDRYDSMDWNRDGKWTEDDHNIALAEAGGILDHQFTGLSTCTGCGVRVGANQLRFGARFGSVWVMVFLSDGAANLSDLPDPSDPNNNIPPAMVNGFCGGSIGQLFWTTTCFDDNITPRFCLDSDASTCPPGSTHTTDSPPYSVLDYAMDMVDEAALTHSANTNEPRGNELAIYSIRLGTQTAGSAEEFLRYMAAVGDDGDRATDACASVAANTSCGQYYNAPTSDRLKPIFEEIAARIYTRITQ